MVVVAESSAADLLDVLGKAGAFPAVETRWADAPAAIAEIQPVALAIADPEGSPSSQHVHAVMQCIETRGGPVTPVIALVERNCSPAIPSALAIGMDDSTDQLIARLRSVLRIRALHATVLRQARRISVSLSFSLMSRRVNPFAFLSAGTISAAFVTQSLTSSKPFRNAVPASPLTA